MTAFNQARRDPLPQQVEYQGRWVDKAHFRAFVYNEKEQKLAGSHEEYEKLISSGLWFSCRSDVENHLENKKISELKPINCESKIIEDRSDSDSDKKSRRELAKEKLKSALSSTLGE